MKKTNNTKITTLIIFIILVIATLPIKVLAVNENYIDVKVSGELDYTKSQEVLNIVNKKRQENGLNNLTMDEELLEAAMKRAVETGIYFSHTRPNGTSCFTASLNMWGENIAAGSSTAEGAMNQWMNSPGHKANILTKDYKSIGIGCFKNGAIYYWVQCFGVDDASKATSKTGIQNTTMTIPILKQNAEVYAYTVKNDSNFNYMKPSETGYIMYGIKNAGWNRVYSPGIESDYVFSSSNTKVITIDSKGNFKAIGEGTATIKVCLKSDTSKVFTENITVKGNAKISSDKCETTLSISACTYNGKSKKPTVKVKYGNNTLKEGKDYTVSYASGRKKVGKYEVKVKFKGDYTGTKKLYFTINPKGTSISKLTSGKQKFNAKWKKQITQTTGYQVQYSTSNKFKNAKTEKVTKNKTTSKTISKLKSNKKYYVKIRTYKVVNGKTYYSPWSSSKSVKIKK